MENLYKENINHTEFYSLSELAEIFDSCGKNVYVDRTVRIFGGKRIRIGNSVRIDSYTILSAGSDGINLNNYIHIGPFCQLNGSGGLIEINNFCSISSRVSLFTASDDYSQGWMTGPMIPSKYRKISTGEIVLSEHCIIGCNSIIMPNSYIGYGASVGAMSLVNKSVSNGLIVSGCPIRKIGERDTSKLYYFEKEFYEEFGRDN